MMIFRFRADAIARYCPVLMTATLMIATGILHADETAPRFIQASATIFSHPHDLTLGPQGRYLYVADMKNDVIRVLDPHSLRLLGEFGRSVLDSPHDVAFNRQGRLLVADSGNDRIAIFHIDGVHGTYSGELKDGLDSPEGVAIGPDERIYVTNAGNHTVVIFKDGKKIAEAGAHGSGNGEYVRPHDIEVAPDGSIYVGDAGNNRIQILDGQLQIMASLGGAAFGFDEPKYLALDTQGRLYVADQHNHQLKIFDRRLRLAAIIGNGRAGDGPGQLDRPEGVETKGAYIWIADTYNDRILLYQWGSQAGKR